MTPPPTPLSNTWPTYQFPLPTLPPSTFAFIIATATE